MADSSLDPIQSLLAAQQRVDSTVSAATANSPLLTQPWSKELVSQLALSSLLFCAFVLLLCTVLLWRSRASGQIILRTFGIISIIGFSAMLLIVGYNNDQLTPVVGLFGAIAGYLLGKDTKTEVANTKHANPGHARDEVP